MDYGLVYASKSFTACGSTAALALADSIACTQLATEVGRTDMALRCVFGACLGSAGLYGAVRRRCALHAQHGLAGVPGEACMHACMRRVAVWPMWTM